MSVQNNIAGGESVVLERPAVGGVYASLFEKINLNPVSELSALDIWQDAQAMAGNFLCTSGPCIRAPVSRKAASCRRLAVCCLPVVAPKGWQSNSPP